MKGIFFILVSCVTIILMQVTVKNLTKHFSSFMVLGVRGALLFIVNSAIIFRKGIDYNIRDPASTYLHIRSFSSFGLSINFEFCCCYSLSGIIEIFAHWSP